MTIRTLPNQALPNSSTTLYLLWYWFDFMHKAPPNGPGWTVPRSSSGLVGGAGDNIASVSDLNRYSASTQRSWFVLRSPDGLREFLFFRISVTNAQWQVHYSPTAGFTGGDAWNYPNAPDVSYIHNDSPSDGYIGVLHCAADDSAPYGWWTFVGNAGNVAYCYYAMAYIPMNVAAVSGDADPYVFFYDGGGSGTGYTKGTMGQELYASTEAHCYARNPIGPPNVLAFCPALYLRSGNSDDGIPDFCEQLPDGSDLTVPITFMRRTGVGSGFFKGVSSFLQWNGTVRRTGEMFTDRSRVSLGQVNAPWDGVSVFLGS